MLPMLPKVYAKKTALERFLGPEGWVILTDLNGSGQVKFRLNEDGSVSKNDTPGFHPDDAQGMTFDEAVEEILRLVNKSWLPG